MPDQTQEKANTNKLNQQPTEARASKGSSKSDAGKGSGMGKDCGC